MAINLLSHYDLGHQSYQQSRVWVGLVSDVMPIVMGVEHLFSLSLWQIRFLMDNPREVYAFPLD